MAASREQVIRNAEKYVSRGRIDAAIREYRKVLDDHPDDVNTLNRLGDLYARLQRFDEAVELFERIARGYTDDGFFVKAIAIYKKIIKLDPIRLEVYEELAELYHKQGLVNEARSQYQVLADYYQKHDNATSAIGIYLKMADLEPGNPSHHVKLAELYQRARLIDKAMGQYRIIAELMLEHGHVGEGVQVYLRALDVDAKNIAFITDAVMKLREAGHVGEAARLLAAAVERNPEATKVARLAGLVAEEEKREEEVTAAGEPEVDTKATAAAAEPAVAIPEDEGEAESEERVVLEIDAAEPLGADLGTVAEPEEPEEPDEEAFPSLATEETGAGPVLEDQEIDLDLSDVFTLDLDDDEMPASQVKPPPDMLDGRPALAFSDRSAPAAEPVEETGASEVLEEAPVPEMLSAETEIPTDKAAPSEELIATEEVIELLEEGPVEVEAARTSPSASTGLDLDTDFLERTAAELHPEPPVSDADLVTEAEVFAKYGLESKAIDRLEEALRINPRNLEAYALLIEVHLGEKHPSKVTSLAEKMADLADAMGDEIYWPRLRARLVEAGYKVEGERISAPPKRPARSKGIDRLLENLLGEAGGAGRRKRPPAPKPPPAEAAAPSQEAPPTRDDITLGGIFAELPELPEPPRPKVGGAEEPRASEDSGIAWLDRVESTRHGTSVGGEGAVVYSDEDEFFDLGAELEQELSAEESHRPGPADMAPPREQSLEEIVEGFKKGVADSLSAEDYDTHFNLGIAYREMGLMDEAIGEFQLASKDRSHLVECCSMLGLCFLEKGLPELAIKWYRRGLEAADLSEDETLGLLYDMGNVYLAMGDEGAAYKTYVEIYGINTNYRDVVAKLEELG